MLYWIPKEQGPRTCESNRDIYLLLSALSFVFRRDLDYCIFLSSAEAKASLGLTAESPSTTS